MAAKAAVKHKQDLREVVRLVNVARKALGRPRISELRKGFRAKSDTCPLAMSLHATVGDSCAIWDDEDSETVQKVGEAWGTAYGDGLVELPAALSVFVHDFDQGNYPDLERQT